MNSIRYNNYIISMCIFARNQIENKLLTSLNNNSSYNKLFSSEQNSFFNADNNRKLRKDALPFDKIPTPRRIPYFGTSLDLLMAGSAPQLHKYIDKRHKKLGPIFREPIGPIEAVFVASPNLMRSVFLYEGQYPSHPIPEAWIIYNKKFNCHRGLFFMEGEEWLTNRKIMNRLLLNGDLKWMEDLIQIATKNTINQWFIDIGDKNDEQFNIISNLEEKLYRWSIEVIFTIMFGKGQQNNNRKLEKIIDEFSKNVQNIFKTSSKFINFPAKIAEKFNMKSWIKFEECVTNTLDLGNQIIDLAIKEGAEEKSLIKLMLNAEIPLNDIKRIFVDFIIAAGDTTAFSTQWALHLLAKHPHVQTQAISAIEKCKNEENSYIRGIIRETLRLYPVAPFVGRFLASDAIIGDYKIDKNTLVLLSLFTSGRSNESFPEPEQFQPSRWLRTVDGKLQSVLHAHGTLPFAIGSRSCIGRKIALIQMQNLITMILSNFKLRSFNETPIDIVLRMVAVPNNRIKIGFRKI